MGKTQTICLFASHAFWSHNLEMQKHEITPDTTRVQTCSITNTTFWGNLEWFNWPAGSTGPALPYTTNFRLRRYAWKTAIWAIFEDFTVFWVGRGTQIDRYGLQCSADQKILSGKWKKEDWKKVMSCLELLWGKRTEKANKIWCSNFMIVYQKCMGLYLILGYGTSDRYDQC